MKCLVKVNVNKCTNTNKLLAPSRRRNVKKCEDSINELVTCHYWIWSTTSHTYIFQAMYLEMLIIQVSPSL